MGQSVCKKQIASRVGHRSCVARPKAAVIPVGRCIEDRFLFEGVRVISHHPAVIRLNIAGITGVDEMRASLHRGNAVYDSSGSMPPPGE